jgi:hypothetical protein
MADKKDEKKEKAGELCHISICVAENGYKICCSYSPESTLSQRAGWVPCMPGESKDYVEKTKSALLKTLAEIL